MARWPFLLAVAGLLCIVQAGNARADAHRNAPPALSISALPEGVDPAAAAVAGGLFDAAFQPLAGAAPYFAKAAARWYRLRLTADWRARSAPLHPAYAAPA